MNTLPSRPTSADLLDAALADLDRAASEVMKHNWKQMQHPRIRAWLTSDRREPDNGVAGIVSTAPHAQIRARLLRGEEVTIAEVSDAIARMQRNLARKVKRLEERAKEAAERRAA